MRLTKRDEYGNADIIAISDAMPEIYAGLGFSETNALTNVLNKLAEYEDAEEQGRLVKLSCAVGDTVWFKEKLTLEKRITKGIVENIVIHKNNKIIWVYENGVRWDFYGEDVGKKLFLVREEAESALKGADE